MRGNPEVVDYLNMLIGGELAARDQYLIHSRMYEDWGLSKIFERIDHEMQEEAQHADAIIRRVLFLEGTPNMQRDDVELGEDVVSCLKADLKLEYHVREKLAQGVKLCEEKGDYIICKTTFSLKCKRYMPLYVKSGMYIYMLSN